MEHRLAEVVGLTIAILPFLVPYIIFDGLGSVISGLLSLQGGAVCYG